MPNDGDLVDLIPDWIVEEAARRQILVDDPSRLPTITYRRVHSRRTSVAPVRKAAEKAGKPRKTLAMGFHQPPFYELLRRSLQSWGRAMTLADITLMAFTLCNIFRVVAYLPQILKAATDESGARAISSTTWGLFLISHLSTAAYALVNQGDWGMASIFLANAAGCAVILLVAAWRRALLRAAQNSYATVLQ